jgi:hypothetical protein
MIRMKRRKTIITAMINGSKVHLCEEVFTSADKFVNMIRQNWMIIKALPMRIINRTGATGTRKAPSPSYSHPEKAVTVKLHPE